jgi:hypothetical protein
MKQPDCPSIEGGKQQQHCSADLRKADITIPILLIVGEVPTRTVGGVYELRCDIALLFARIRSESGVDQTVARSSPSKHPANERDDGCSSDVATKDLGMAEEL